MLSNILAYVNGDGSWWAGQYRDPNKVYFDLKYWGEPFLYALIGLLVVFAGIVIIIAVIWLIGLIMRKTNNLEFLTKKREKKVKNKVEETPATVKETEVDEGDIPAEVKVAIVASIMAYYENKQEKCEFTVKRIKRL